MKYRECKTLCAKGCGRKRRKGGRYCKNCHAEAMRESRRADPGNEVERVVTRAVRRRGGLTPELKEKIAVLAQQVARQIDEMNGGAV